MSYKSNNGIKMTKCDSQQWKTASVLETSVKFAGEEAKDRLYEPKHKKKLVRVLTVVAYVFFVSLAAIMLSLYYVFLWNEDQKMTKKYVTSRQRELYLSDCRRLLAEFHEKQEVSSLMPTTIEDSVTWSDDYEFLEGFKKTNPLIKKIMDSKYYQNY